MFINPIINYYVLVTVLKARDAAGNKPTWSCSSTQHSAWYTVGNQYIFVEPREIRKHYIVWESETSTNNPQDHTDIPITQEKQV